MATTNEMRKLRVASDSRFFIYNIASDVDLMQFPLSNCIVGVNNKLYATLGSYSDIAPGSEVYNKYIEQGVFTEEELRFNCRVRLLELKLNTRTHDDDYDTVTGLDFKGLAEFANDPKNVEKFESLHLSHIDDSMILLPLGSKVLRQAANYAYQEIGSLYGEDSYMRFAPMF